MVWLINNVQMGATAMAMAPTTTTAATATTAMAVTNSLDQDLELHISPIQHLAKPSTTIRKRIISKVTATKGNLMMYVR